MSLGNHQWVQETLQHTVPNCLIPAPATLVPEPGRTEGKTHGLIAADDYNSLITKIRGTDLLHLEFSG